MPGQAGAQHAAPLHENRFAPTLEAVREDGYQGVVGESGVAVFAGRDVRHTAAAVALDCPRAVHGDGGAAKAVHDSGVDGDNVAGAAESVAGSECIANGNAFHASAETGG